MTWTERAGPQVLFLRVDTVFLKLKPISKLSTHRHSIFPWTIEVQSESSPRGRDVLCFEVCLNAVPMPASFQSNSSCLEIHHFRKTATGRVYLGQHFYWICQQNSFFQIIQWYHCNWNGSSHLYFINVCNLTLRRTGLCMCGWGNECVGNDLG